MPTSFGSRPKIWTTGGRPPSASSGSAQAWGYSPHHSSAFSGPRWPRGGAPPSLAPSPFHDCSQGAPASFAGSLPARHQSSRHGTRLIRLSSACRRRPGVFPRVFSAPAGAHWPTRKCSSSVAPWLFALGDPFRESPTCGYPPPIGPSWPDLGRLGAGSTLTREAGYPSGGARVGGVPSGVLHPSSVKGVLVHSGLLASEPPLPPPVGRWPFGRPPRDFRIMWVVPPLWADLL